MKIILLGGGGFAREILETIEYINDYTENKIDPLGFIYDGGENDKGKLIHDCPVLGGISHLKEIDLKKIYLVAAAGRSVWRRSMVQRAKKYGAQFTNIIHPTAIISRWTEIGEGAIIQSHCMIQPDCKIGNFFTCNGTVRIGHDTLIGDFVHINPTVNIAGGTFIGDDVFIGVKATVLKSQIGNGSIIGACALITKDVPENVVAKGIPAKYDELYDKKY